MSLADKLLSFDGRLRRRDWWLCSILLIVVSIAVSQAAIYFTLGADFMMFGHGDKIEKATNTTALSIQIIIGLLLLWPSLALNAKRTHDRDQGAAFNMGVAIVSQLASIAYAVMLMQGMIDLTQPSVTMLISFVPLLLGLYLLVVLGFLDGTPEENRFGPSPKDHG